MKGSVEMNPGNFAEISNENQDSVVPIAYAGFWRRVGAYFIDAIITFIITLIIAIPVGPVIVFAGLAQKFLADPKALDHLATFLGIVVVWVYFAYCESSTKQATLGKKAMGIYVQGINGQRITFANATGRFFGKILSGLLLCIGFAMVAFTARKQGLHDMMARTVVVKRKA